MHRTSARPAPLHFPLPRSHSSITYNFDRRKDIGHLHPLPNLIPGYLEAPIRDGLRTPPADDMGTTYQQPQYNSYNGRQDTTYPTPFPSAAGGSYSGTYPGTATGGQHRAYPFPLNQPPPASNLRHEVRPVSPQLANKSNYLAPPEELPRRKSASSDMILPNLQIPTSINNSGGSLAEFAAQVGCQASSSSPMLIA